jgi:iron complex transport system ATP-binding protein
MKDGEILAEGEPGNVVTDSLVEEAFGLANVIMEDPVSKTPLVIPLRSSGQIGQE